MHLPHTSGAPIADTLIRGMRTKSFLALGCLALLVVGALVAPPAVHRPAPQEQVAPLLQAEVQRRTPQPAFQDVREASDRALRHVVVFHGDEPPPGASTFTDYGDAPRQKAHRDYAGTLVTSAGEVLTHVAAVGSSVALQASLQDARVAGFLYVVLRMVGKLSGARLGLRGRDVPDGVRRYLGLCIVSSSSLAIGLTIQVRTSFPDLAPMVIAIVLAAVLIFEIVGPVLTRQALIRSGEARTMPAPLEETTEPNMTP